MGVLGNCLADRQRLPMKALVEIPKKNCKLLTYKWFAV